MAFEPTTLSLEGSTTSAMVRPSVAAVTFSTRCRSAATRTRSTFSSANITSGRVCKKAGRRGGVAKNVAIRPPNQRLAEMLESRNLL